MARKTKEEAEATRERLLDAAEAVFLRQGVARTTLEAIARQAGLTRGAIYWHFRDKSDLLEAMAGRVRPPLAELVESHCREADGDPVETLRQLCLFGLRRLTDDPRHRRVYTILLHRCERIDEINPAVSGQDALIREVLTLFEGLFERARAQGRLNPAITPRVAATGLHAYMAGLYSQYLREPDDCDLDQHAEALLEAFFGSLFLAPEGAGELPGRTV
ncbi:TetR family transcriptional regulator [Arhodomonas sp. SL1]|uniref:TetR family transcriptional regulator n=1 Tax=Arhodomonas sp. SL1 TaxID=3425691 RepID=UPI003F8839E7